MNDWIPAVALVDSGAACCFISRTFVNQHNIEILEGGKYNVTLADKSTTTINEIVFITLELPNVKFTMSAIVMDALATSDLILGINFLRTFNPTIDWSNLNMYIDTSKYVPAVTDGMSPSDIVLASFTIVPLISTKTSTVKSNLGSPVPLVHSTAVPTTSVHANSNNQPCSTIKQISARKMKQLLKDPSNIVLASIIMLPPSSTNPSVDTNLSNIQIISGNNSNYP